MPPLRRTTILEWKSRSSSERCATSGRAGSALATASRSSARNRFIGLEADARHGALVLGKLEELPLAEAECARHQIGWELQHACVEIAHDGVVVAPRILHRVFDLAEIG